MTEHKNNNKSMFLYTALIFIMAILLIIISFFGQTNLEKNLPESVSESEQTGISEKATLLSEENKNLVKENTTLKETLADYIEKEKQYTSLLNADTSLVSGDSAKALEYLSEIEYDKLSDEMKAIYDKIKQSVPEDGTSAAEQPQTE